MSNTLCDPIRVAGIVNDSITDGPGFRLTLFVQGCRRACPGCHNPTTWDLDGGEVKTGQEILEQIRKNPLLDGVTFSGGEPFLQAAALVPLARAVKELGLDLAIYTGYTLEELLAEAAPGVRDLLEAADVLIDGPFQKEKRNLALPFRGSENQRILSVPASLAAGQAVWTKDPDWGV